MKNEQENDGAESTPKEYGSQPVGIDEKAQYEVFRNGELPRASIREWLRGDLDTVAALVYSIKSDEVVLDALTDALYSKYLKLHSPKAAENDESHG